VTIERIREAHQARPFKPFTLRTGGGREYSVRHPEFMAMTPGGRTVIVTHNEESVEMIDLLLVESLHFNGHGKNRPGVSRRRR
jgi:hypothetical protein